MRGRTRYLAGGAIATLVVVAALGSCTSHSKPKMHALSGTVTDRRTGKPLGAVAVMIGARRTVSDAAGQFSFTDLANAPATITAHAPHYSDGHIVAPSAQPYTVTLALDPIAISVKIIDNLLHRGVAATVAGPSGVASQTSNGAVTLYNVGPGDQVSIMAKGYETAKTTIAVSGPTSVTVRALPATMSRYLFDLEIHQRYSTEVKFVHPDELRFVTATQIVNAFHADDTAGYSTIRVAIKSVTIIPSWHFPGCGGQGARTYRHVAAVEYSELQSAPSGGSSTINGVEHLVQVPSGYWEWFPTVPQCA